MTPHPRIPLVAGVSEARPQLLSRLSLPELPLCASRPQGASFRGVMG